MSRFRKGSAKSTSSTEISIASVDCSNSDGVLLTYVKQFTDKESHLKKTRLQSWNPVRYPAGLTHSYRLHVDGENLTVSQRPFLEDKSKAATKLRDEILPYLGSNEGTMSKYDKQEEGDEKGGAIWRHRLTVTLRLSIRCSRDSHGRVTAFYLLPSATDQIKQIKDRIKAEQKAIADKAKSDKAQHKKDQHHNHHRSNEEKNHNHHRSRPVK